MTPNSDPFAAKKTNVIYLVLEFTLRKPSWFNDMVSLDQENHCTLLMSLMSLGPKHNYNLLHFVV